MMKWVTKLLNIGFVQGDDENSQNQKQFVIAEGLLMSMGGILWGTIALFIDRQVQSTIPFAYVVLTAFNLFYFYKSKNFRFVRDFQTLISLLLPFLFQWVLGGFHASGGVMLWAMLAVAASLSYQSTKSSLFWLSIYLILCIISGIFDNYFINWIQPNTPLDLSVILYTVNIVVISSAVFALIIFYILRNNTLMLLKKTYLKLIQSEKMAALGQVSAGVAHEVNTPLGAIRTSSEESSIALMEAIRSLPVLYNKLDQEKREAFGEVIQSYENSGQYLSTKEERNLSLNLEKELEIYGIKDDGAIADKLIQSGIYHCTPSLILLLKCSEREEIIELIYNILTLKKNNSNVKIAAEKASRVVGALKSYLHSNDGLQEETDIGENIEVVLSIYHNLMKHGIEVILDFDKVSKIMANRSELNQVWTNLIHNAIQAMNYKGKLIISVKQKNDFIEVAISDNGPGIPDKLKVKIFEPFFTTKKSGEGTGLGLDIVKKIVSLHHGSISFESEVGKGTTFYVKLPVKS